jgi:DNA-binding transcriptional MerR regulator
MLGSHHFSTSEVCKLFKIDRSRLFNWEHKKRISKVPREGGTKNRRQYDAKSLKEIYKELTSDSYSELYSKKSGRKSASKYLDNVSNRRARFQRHEADKDLLRFFSGDNTGLEQLFESPGPLPKDYVERLLTFIMIKYRDNPDHPIFLSVIELIYLRNVAIGPRRIHEEAQYDQSNSTE